MTIKAEVGKRETASDCRAELEIKKSGGLKVELKSKLSSMYGKSIREQAEKILAFYRIKNAHFFLEDGGSLPFVLSARIEAVIKKCLPAEKREYVAPIPAHNIYEVSRDRFRRSRLYIPGDQPRLIVNVGLFRPDGVILDLEDAVAPLERESTRYIVRNALREVDFMGAEKMVRINQLPMGLVDLEYIVPHGVHTVLIPKCETPETIQEVEAKILSLKTRHRLKRNIFLMPIIESALGIINAYGIASASPNTVALAIGLEDFTADIGAERTLEGEESFLARLQIVLAARAAGIQPIDSVFSDVADEEGLKQSVLEAKSLGFEGKGCIHPSQIKIVNEGFAPTEQEIERAKKISLALEEAQKRGSGVVALGNKMIDPPVVKRAERIIKVAIQNNQIPANWKEGMKDEGKN